jgi:hypothetical protein
MNVTDAKNNVSLKMNDVMLKKGKRDADRAMELEIKKIQAEKEMRLSS